MRLTVTKSLTLSLALVAGVALVGAAESGAGKSAARPQPKSDAAQVKERAVAQRDSLIAEYDALARQLKDATAEQRKAILEKMEAQQKKFEEAQSALHKQIRDEQRRQRQNAAPGKR